MKKKTNYDFDLIYRLALNAVALGVDRKWKWIAEKYYETTGVRAQPHTMQSKYSAYRRRQTPVLPTLRRMPTGTKPAVQHMPAQRDDAKKTDDTHDDLADAGTVSGSRVRFCPHCGFEIGTLVDLMRIARQTS